LLRMAGIRKTTGVFLLSAAVTGIFLLPYCDFLFKCGCTFFWTTGVSLCNIYQPLTPHCPWCEARSPLLQTIPFLLVLLGQGVVIRSLDKKYDWPWAKLFLASLAVFLILGAVHGLFFKLLDDYPHFLFY